MKMHKAVTKSGTGTWDVGQEDVGTWGRGDVGTRGLRNSETRGIRGRDKQVEKQANCLLTTDSL